ncbi:hypothetical protein BLA29_010687, partial [Euroglyphus maynei]
MPKSPVTAPNLVSIQQQTNPMLNAQLSGVGLQRLSRSTRPQGPRFFPSRQGQQFAMQTAIQQQQPQNTHHSTQQFINQQNHLHHHQTQQQQQQQQPMTIPNIQHLVQPRRLTLRMPIQTQHIQQQQQQQQSFTINTQTNVKLSIQSQQQITASVVDNSFVGISGANNNNGNKISPTIFAQQQQQQQPQISQQINLNDLSGFDNLDGL